jgi:hypothetical protein
MRDWTRAIFLLRPPELKSATAAQSAGWIEDGCRSSTPGVPGITTNKHKTKNIMKKYIIIAAAAIVASIGGTYAANSLRNLEDHSKCETGYKCTGCNGTGFKGNFNCYLCKGTGRSNSY